MSKLSIGASGRRRCPGSEIDEADDGLLERAERAVKRRAHILQEIKTISQLPDTVPLPDAAVQLSNAAVPISCAERRAAAAQLSNPAIQIILPFPFIGHRTPERFRYGGDHDYWEYIGREKFTDLLVWWGGSDPYHGVLVWSDHSNSWHSPRDRQSGILSQSFLRCCCPRTSLLAHLIPPH